MAKYYFNPSTSSPGTSGDFFITTNWYINNLSTQASGQPTSTDDVIIVKTTPKTFFHNRVGANFNLTYNSLCCVNTTLSSYHPPNAALAPNNLTINCATSAIFLSSTVMCNLSTQQGCYFFGNSSYVPDFGFYCLSGTGTSLIGTLPSIAKNAGTQIFVSTFATRAFSLTSNAYYYDNSSNAGNVIIGNGYFKNKSSNSFSGTRQLFGFELLVDDSDSPTTYYGAYVTTYGSTIRGNGYFYDDSYNLGFVLNDVYFNNSTNFKLQNNNFSKATLFGLDANGNFSKIITVTQFVYPASQNSVILGDVGNDGGAGFAYNLLPYKNGSGPTIGGDLILNYTSDTFINLISTQNFNYIFGGFLKNNNNQPIAINFRDSSYLQSAFKGTAYFYNSSYNASASPNLSGYFFDNSYNNGTAFYVEMSDSSKNLGVCTNATYFNNLNYSNGTVLNNIYFANNQVTDQTLTLSGNQPLSINFSSNAKCYNTSNQLLTSLVFKDFATYNLPAALNQIIEARFYDNSYNSSYLPGVSYFYDQSYNNGIVNTAYLYTRSNLAFTNGTIKNQAFLANQVDNKSLTVSGTQVLGFSATQFLQILDLNGTPIEVINFYNNSQLQLPVVPSSIKSVNMYDNSSTRLPVSATINFYGTSSNLTSLSGAINFYNGSVNYGNVDFAVFNDRSYNGSGGTYNNSTLNSIASSNKGINGAFLAF